MARRFADNAALIATLSIFVGRVPGLAIELDGEGHFAINADLYEAEHAKYLGSRGIRILRFENKVLLGETSGPNGPSRLRR